MDLNKFTEKSQAALRRRRPSLRAIGGTRLGNGKAAAVSFARKGATIVAVDLNRKAAEETAGIIENEGGNVIALSADVTQSSAVENVVSTQQQRIRPEYESLGHEGVNP